MRKYTPYKLLVILTNFAFASTQTDVFINNGSSCQLTLGNICHDSSKTNLTLPHSIEPNTNGSGRVSFSSNWSSDPQRAVASYLLNCQNKNYLLTLYFYVGKGPSEFDSHVGYWVDKQLMDADTPVIVYPQGKTSIANNTPVVIGLLDTEIIHEPISEAAIEPLPDNDAINGPGTGEDTDISPS